MIKKIGFAVFLLCAASAAFAQNPPRAVLSESDMDIFVEKFDEIEEVLNAHEEELDAAAARSKVDGSGDVSVNEILALRNLAVSPDLRAKLSGLGLGNNGFEKVMVITFGLGYAYTEQMLSALLLEEANPDTPPPSEMADMLRKQMEPVKAAIHEKDLALVVSRMEDLMTIVE